MAPYWDDVDISLAGNISYEVHTRRSNSLASNKLLDDISAYVGQSRNQSFTGAWMLVAEWEGVHPWPHGLNNPFFELFFPEIPLVSGIIIFRTSQYCDLYNGSLLEFV